MSASSSPSDALVEVSFHCAPEFVEEFEFLLDELGVNYTISFDTDPASSDKSADHQNPSTSPENESIFVSVMPSSEWNKIVFAFESSPLPVCYFVRLFEDDSWKTKWQENFVSTSIGKQFLFCLPGKSSERLSSISDSEKRRILELDPGFTFGIGTHPTTQLMVELLEDIDLLDAQVLDVGCGSGILSLVASCLGARKCVGVDIDPHAVEISIQNAERNKIENCSFTTQSLNELEGSFSVVCANVISSVQRELYSEIRRLLSTNGKLLISGILDEEHSIMSEMFVGQHYRFVSRDGWRAYCVGERGLE